MEIDIDKLESAARAATPGPWRTGADCITKTPHQVVSGDDADIMVLMSGNQNFYPQAKLDATYIAAANPAVVLELVRKVRDFKLVAALVIKRDAELAAARALLSAVRAECDANMAAIEKRGGFVDEPPLAERIRIFLRGGAI